MAGEPVGMIGYLNTDAPNLLSEIGFVVVFPAWQRTFVSTHAIGLLLSYALSAPADGGLGLRRVQWQCHNSNAPSRRAAERMGFVLEGEMRWAKVLGEGKEGNGRDFVEGALPGRDSAMFSITWEDWFKDGKKEFVEGLMARPLPEGGIPVKWNPDA
jgi:RimJ/RimL family protein N-acetyltransferase